MTDTLIIAATRDQVAPLIDRARAAMAELDAVAAEYTLLRGPIASMANAMIKNLPAGSGEEEDAIDERLDEATGLGELSDLLYLVYVDSLFDGPTPLLARKLRREPLG